MENSEFLATAFAKYLPSHIKGFERIPRGFKNVSFLIEDVTGSKYVLKVYAKDFLESSIIEAYSSIVETLKNKKIPVLEYIKGSDKKYVQHVKDEEGTYRQLTLSKYVETAVFGEEYLNKTIVEEIAYQLSSLHKALNNIETSEKHRVLNPIATLKDLTDMKTVEMITSYFANNIKRGGRLKKYIEDYLEEGNTLLRYFENRSAYMDQRAQLIHGDFNLSNLDIQSDRVHTIFDFDEMTMGPISFEIGCSLVHLDEGFMFTDELFEVFIHKYKEFFEIPEQEIYDIFMFMKYRCYYRIGRYFTYYRFSKNKVEHFTKYQYKLDRYNMMPINQIIRAIVKVK